MELIVLIIGLLIFGLGVILCITALFLGDCHRNKHTIWLNT